MMFQSYALFPHMSVEKNVAFGLKQDKVPKDEIAERVHNILKLVELEDSKLGNLNSSLVAKDNVWHWPVLW